MQEMTKEQHQQIIDQLQGLNEKLAKQNSWYHIFLMALVYGIGFVIGSSILASILLGFALPTIKEYFGVNLAPHSHYTSDTTQD